MSTIHDSNAFQKKERMLVQHQAILTLIQREIDNPQLVEYKWLDLGCGRGQLIINLEDNFTVESRAKIVYSAFDLKDEHVSQTIKIAEKIGFKAFAGKTGDIIDFPNIYGLDSLFSFISLTNAVHEFSPHSLPNLLYESIIRLDHTGLLFLYDMEQLPVLELGAITWSCIEMQEILKCFLQSIPLPNGYLPQAGQWPHQSCNAWNVIVNRAYINVSNDKIFERKEAIIENTLSKVKEIILRKLENCKISLESITKYGPETEAEEQLKTKLLYDFWALNRYLYGK